MATQAGVNETTANDLIAASGIAQFVIEGPRASPIYEALAMQIVAGGAQAASLLQGGGGTMSQRPVVLLQTLEPEHWIPPAWLQPGTHWPVSQTWVGAPQAASRPASVRTTTGSWPSRRTSTSASRCRPRA